MDDLGAPTSYLACAVGTPVIDATGARVGTVAHVLAVTELDVFDGIVVAAHEHIGGGHRFADADQVAEIHERAVVLSVPWDELHEPSANAATIEVGADDLAKDDGAAVLKDRLRRAWDLISGRG